MKRSTNKILTTHAGSISQPKDLWDLFNSKASGQHVDQEKFATRVRQGVAEVVKKQADAGISVPNDGEQGKVSWQAYVNERLNGWGVDDSPLPTNALAQEFPEYFQQRNANFGPIRQLGGRYACVGALSWKDFGAVETDIANMKAAMRNVNVEEGFLTSLAPGQVATRANRHYKTTDEYTQAIGDLMKREYKAIADAGIVVQLDVILFSANLLGSGAVQEQRKEMARLIEGINYATKGIPQEMLRLHACWGRIEGPKNNNPQLKDMVDVMLKANVQGYSIAGANGRHDFEWKVWKDHKLPEGKVLIAGVMDNTTNIIEHPESISDRIVRYASVVGRENIIGGNDCGFGNTPVMSPASDVEPRVAWAKFKALGDGAAMATKELWRSR